MDEEHASGSCRACCLAAVAVAVVLVVIVLARSARPGSAPRRGCASGRCASTPGCTSSCGVEPARTTSTAPSTIDASRCASGSSITGGVSRMTQSNVCRASSSSRRMRSDVRPAIGSELGRPAGSTASRGDTCRTSILRVAVRQQAVGRGPTRCRAGTPSAASAAAGRASMSSTRFWYDSLNVSARFEAVSVLPSPATALATMTTFRPVVLCASCSTAASRRYCSRDAGLMFWSMTTFSVSRASIRSNSVRSGRGACRLRGRSGSCRDAGVGSGAALRSAAAALGGFDRVRPPAPGPAASLPVSVSSVASVPDVGLGRASAPARRRAAWPRRFDSSTRLTLSGTRTSAAAWSRRRSAVALRSSRSAASPAPAARTRGWLRLAPAEPEHAAAPRRCRRAAGAARQLRPRCASRAAADAEVEVAAHLAHDGAVDRPLPDGKSGQQRVVGDHADRARDAARPLVNQRDGLAREDLRADAAGGADAAGDDSRRSPAASAAAARSAARRAASAAAASRR